MKFMLQTHEMRLEQLTSTVTLDLQTTQNARANVANFKKGPNSGFSNSSRGQGNPRHVKCYHRFDISFHGSDDGNQQHTDQNKVHLATQNTNVDQALYMDSGASTHVTADIQNLGVKTDYKGKEKLIVAPDYSMSNTERVLSEVESTPALIPGNNFSDNNNDGVMSSPTSLLAQTDTPSNPTEPSSPIALVQPSSSSTDALDPLQPVTSSVTFASTHTLYHPMITRAKTGIHKPKIFTAMAKLTNIPLPSSVTEALQNGNWKFAMESEFQTLLRNKTWDLVPFIADMKVVSNKCVMPKILTCIIGQ
ncbi:hypothetical protein PanWU01x14_058320 [Parasponia andersonii]|uniref:Mitochondrial protein n=1 Tax=Parasponia andersonii TaxID=3476 RepID=A0A2P5DJ64_PARAD|nr:hypothetical protein PanWU01x14_058320 [Parasponia andersonii]